MGAWRSPGGTSIILKAARDVKGGSMTDEGSNETP